jgi:hypothetical protein
MNRKRVSGLRSQFFHRRLHLSSPEKLRSSTQRLGISLKACNCLRWQSAPSPADPQEALETLLKRPARMAAVAQQVLYCFVLNFQRRFGSDPAPSAPLAISHIPQNAIETANVNIHAVLMEMASGQLYSID